MEGNRKIIIFNFVLIALANYWLFNIVGEKNYVFIVFFPFLAAFFVVVFFFLRKKISLKIASYINIFFVYFMAVNFVIPILILAFEEAIFSKIVFYIYSVSLCIAIIISTIISLKIECKNVIIIRIQDLISERIIDPELNIFRLKEYFRFLRKLDLSATQNKKKIIAKYWLLLFSLMFLFNMFLQSLSQKQVVFGFSIWAIFVCIVPAILCKNLFLQLKVSYKYFEKYQKQLLIPD